MRRQRMGDENQGPPGRGGGTTGDIEHCFILPSLFHGLK